MASKGQKFNKYTEELKLEIVNKYLNNQGSSRSLAKEYGIEFLYRDFRDGFWVGHDKARELGLYMQKYCGCIFSEEKMVLTHTNERPKLPEGFEFLPVERSIVIKKKRK